MRVVIKSNEYWGRRFGGTYSENRPKNCPLPWGFYVKTSSFGSHHSNTGKTINKPDTLQAKLDREKFILEGRKTLRYDGNGKRIR